MFVLTALNLSQIAGIAHGFFGRQGGVSQGVYASLNCGPGSSDARDNVLENRRRALETLAEGRSRSLVTLYQIHSARAITVTTPWEIVGAPHADAMATNQPGIALGILTADCAPVLLADDQAEVIGAAHAGWKGAEAGVIEAVVEAMTNLGARRAHIRAAVGPCISQKNYEVGPEFRSHFAESAPDNMCFFDRSKRPGHWQFDLEGFVAHRLAQAGIGDIERLSACTYAREDDFFSYRRATHRGEADYGRDISAILLRS
jgi:YfiH family protein